MYIYVHERCKLNCSMKYTLTYIFILSLYLKCNVYDALPTTTVLMKTYKNLFIIPCICINIFTCICIYIIIFILYYIYYVVLDFPWSQQPEWREFLLTVYAAINIQEQQVVSK